MDVGPIRLFSFMLVFCSNLSPQIIDLTDTKCSHALTIRYPAINKPAGVLHWLHHAQIDAEYIVILDADMIMRGPITPWEFNAARGHPVAAPYNHLIGCNNILAKLHTHNPEGCDKVGGVIIIHIDDLRKLALYWLLKTEEVRADREHYATDITGNIYQSESISEMYGYSFAAAELNLRHIIDNSLMIYTGSYPERNVNYRVFHYGLPFRVGNWTFDKAKWRSIQLVNNCWAMFPDPPNPLFLDRTNEDLYQRDLMSIECSKTLNDGLFQHHKKNCPDQNATNKENILREFQKVTERDNSSKISSFDESDKPREVSNPHSPDKLFISLRIWVIGLWIVSFLGFLAVIAAYFSCGKKQKSKSKHYKSKTRLYKKCEKL